MRHTPKSILRAAAVLAVFSAGRLAAQQPTSMATADFNEDGYPDVASAYAISGAGTIRIEFGNGALAARAGHTEHAALTPDFLAAGDFNGDGHFDLVVAARGADRLILLAGDGKGHFAKAETIALPGRLTAFAAGEVNRADGLADLVAAVSGADGNRLLVFESPNGALSAGPESVALPAAATRLEVRDSAESAWHDVGVETEGGAYRLVGRDRRLSLPAAERSGGQLVQESAEAKPKERAHASGASNGAPPATAYTVNSAGNQGDGDTSDGVCDTGNATVGFTSLCTLTAAIQQANASGNPASILFHPSVVTIVPDGIYPDILVPVTVDGLTGRTKRVQLDGRNAFGGNQIYDPSGLVLAGGFSTVKGMTIFNFVTGVKVVTFGNDTIQNNWIGMDNTGSIPAGRPMLAGVLVEGFANSNLVGGTAPGQGNVISTGAYGVGISFQSNSNTLQGNLIGTDPTGTLLLGNQRGVSIQNVTGNLIGGTTAGARNVIAGNANGSVGANVQVTSANGVVNANLIAGNYIGTDITGTVALGGVNGGVYAEGDTTIGGTTAAARNVISGNGNYGVNVVSSSALLEGNYIGLNAAGTAALGNGCCGIQVSFDNAVIGGAGSAGNVISGNLGAGVLVNKSYAVGVQVLGNIIGLDATGTSAVGNAGDGISNADISGHGHQFGTPGSGNVVSGNRGNGIYSAAGSITIAGNLVGTNAAGNAAVGNLLDGIAVNSGNGGTIGGAASGAGNLVSGNRGNGITITANNFNPFTVQGNLIGTDRTGTQAIANGGNGVFLDSGSIPGTCGNCSAYYGTLTGNTIANNTMAGVDLNSAYYIGLRTNAIYLNRSTGIALRNNSNSGIAAPVLTAAALSGGTLTVDGSLANAPGGVPATIEVFDNNASDSPVEGRKPLGTATVNATGTFHITVPAAAAALVTATVTDNANETSAFSNGIALAQSSCAANAGSSISVVNTSSRYNAATHLYLRYDTIKNTTSAPIAAPIYLAVDNLSGNASVSGSTGVTSCSGAGSPYVKVLSGGSLAPGASIQVELKFSDPTGTPFTYQDRVLDGPGQP